MEGLVGSKVLLREEEKEVSAVCSGDDLVAIGIYFSAHWCPPCRGFTPVLRDFYNAVNKDKKQFEVIFVSSDRDEGSFKEYFSEMPWHALPFSDRGKKEELATKYSVRGIPTLVIVKKDGTTITQEGRGEVQSAEGVIPGTWTK